MSEGIKKALSDCSGLPMVPPYSCLLSHTLTNVVEKVKSLSYKELADILEYAKKLALPQDFLRELEDRLHNYKQKLKFL
jgi:hypothetical protein